VDVPTCGFQPVLKLPFDIVLGQDGRPALLRLRPGRNEAGIFNVTRIEVVAEVPIWSRTAKNLAGGGEVFPAFKR
jgi:hypothetical protein